MGWFQKFSLGWFFRRRRAHRIVHVLAVQTDARAFLAIGATCGVRVFCSIRRATVDGPGNRALMHGYGTMPIQFTSQYI